MLAPSPPAPPVTVGPPPAPPLAPPIGLPPGPPPVAIVAPLAPPIASQSASPTDRRARWPLAVLVVAVAASVVTQIGPGGALLFGFALAVPVERIWRRHDFGVRRPGLRTDAFHLMFTGAVQTAALIVAVVICMVPMWPLLDNPLAQAFQRLPTLAQAAIALVTFEMMGYWYHRMAHEVPFLWRFHAVHHSSERLDWIAAARLHPLEGFFGGLVAAPPLLLLGVRPTTLGVVGVVTQLWAITLHMNVRWRMRWLDGIWGTPEYHHWHHSNHPEAHDRNYSGLLPVLDLLFGTYYLPKDRRPEVYGIDDPMPEGYLAQLVHPLRRRRPAGPIAAGPVSLPVSPPVPGSWPLAGPTLHAMPGTAPGGTAPTPAPHQALHPAPTGWVPPGHPGPGPG